jgi:hypothetical protein
MSGSNSSRSCTELAGGRADEPTTNQSDPICSRAWMRAARFSTRSLNSLHGSLAARDRTYVDSWLGRCAPRASAAAGEPSTMNTSVAGLSHEPRVTVSTKGATARGVPVDGAAEFAVLTRYFRPPRRGCAAIRPACGGTRRALCPTPTRPSARCTHARCEARLCAKCPVANTPLRGTLRRAPGSVPLLNTCDVGSRCGPSCHS